MTVVFDQSALGLGLTPSTYGLCRQYGGEPPELSGFDTDAFDVDSFDVNSFVLE